MIGVSSNPSILALLVMFFTIRVRYKWHMDEMCLVMKGKKDWLWRAADQEGYELDILLQSRKNKEAGLRFFRKLLKGLLYVPGVIITDKLASYGAGKREILPGVEHRSHKQLC